VVDDPTSMKISARDKKLFPPIKLNALVLCEDLLLACQGLKEILSQIAALQMVDERTKFITRTIIDMREAIDTWPSRRLEYYKPKGGTDDFSKLINTLDMWLWDITARIEGMQAYCLHSESYHTLAEIQTEFLRMRWFVHAFEEAQEAADEKIDEMLAPGGTVVGGAEGGTSPRESNKKAKGSSSSGNLPTKKKAEKAEKTDKIDKTTDKKKSKSSVPRGLTLWGKKKKKDDEE